MAILSLEKSAKPRPQAAGRKARAENKRAKRRIMAKHESNEIRVKRNETSWKRESENIERRD